MTLQDELEIARRDIRTDGYPMSIGEWMNLYTDNELDIHPEFQRFYRWSPTQKSRLVESILLGIPIPPIYVAQRDDGIWDVVDGLQRLSTIFEFTGILFDEDHNKQPPLSLERTTYLPALEHMQWENSERPDQSFTPQQRLYFKRAKIDVSIILRESDEKTKYELFQRLNTGGSHLSEQEVRNCLLVQANRDIYWWLRGLSSDANFQECISLTDKALDEQYDMELALRFLVLRQLNHQSLQRIGDIGQFLTDQMLSFATDPLYDRLQEESAFVHTFSVLSSATSSSSFKKYDPQRRRFVGGFLVSAYETVALGVGYNESTITSSPIDIEEKVKELWSNQDFINSSGSGVRASSRLPKVIPLGRELFRP